MECIEGIQQVKGRARSSLIGVVEKSQQWLSGGLSNHTSHRRSIGLITVGQTVKPTILYFSKEEILSK